MANPQPIPFPMAGTTTTPEILASLKSKGMIPSGISVYASIQHYGETTGAIAPGDGGAGKIWQAPDYNWLQPADPNLLYIAIDESNPELPLPPQPGPNANPETVTFGGPGEGYQHLTFGVYGSAVAQFLQATKWPSVTRLKVVEVPASEAIRLELHRTNETFVPVARLFEDRAQSSLVHRGVRYRTSWNKDWFLANVDGKVQAVPIGYVPASLAAPKKLSDFDLVQSVFALMNSGVSVPDMARGIRALAGR